MPIPTAVAALGMQAAGNVVNEGMGIAFQGVKNKQQLKQARRLQDLGLEAEATRMQRNEEMAMRMWEKTGYGAQVEQMKKAGINPGLLYGMGGGGGGATAAAPSTGGTASAGTASPSAMGIQSGAELALLEAQRKNIEADTKLKEVDAKKTEGVDTDKTKSEIESILQGVTNAKVQEKILEFERRIKKVDANVSEQTEPDRMGQIASMAESAAAAANIIQNEEKISDATKESKINQIKAEALGAVLRNELTSAQTGKTVAEIHKVAAEISTLVVNMGIEWQKLSNEQKKTMLQERLIKFNTAQSQRTYDNILKGINTVSQLLPGKTVITPTSDGGKTIITQ